MDTRRRAIMPKAAHFRRLLIILLLLACLPPSPAAGAPGPAAPEPALYLPLVANLRQIIPLDLEVSEPALAPGKVIFVGVDATGGTDVYALDLATRDLANLTNTPDVVEETPLIGLNNLTLIYAAQDARSWNLYGRDLDGGQSYLLVQDSGADEVHPSFAADGTRLLFASNQAGGNWDIYSASLAAGPPAQPVVRLTADPATERFPVGAQGNTIIFRREQAGAAGLQSSLYIMPDTGGAAHLLTPNAGFFSYPAATPVHAGLVYVASSAAASAGGLFAANLGGGGVLPLAAGESLAASPRFSSSGAQLVYTMPWSGRRALVIQSFDDPLLQVGRAGYARLSDECSWENGVMATGWVEAGRATGDPHYLAWVRAWVDGCLARGATITHANDVPLAFAALALQAETPDGRYAAVAQAAADYIFEQAPRAPDGTLIHLDNMVWDDTLIGVVPFLISMYATSGEARYLDEAVAQVLKHSAHLQDAATGLYHHAWRPATDSLDGPAYWGRGNGWVLLAVAELLAALPPEHPQYGAVLDAYQRHAAGLLAYQDSSGRWRTVINRPDAYLETSASALIVAGLATGLRSNAPAGALDRQALAAGIAQGLPGVWGQVDPAGIVGGVSAPTWPMPEDEYLLRPISSFERYGQGVVLLMGAAARAVTD
jgi:rhamnogalacturonyl hydrolase YesR